MLHRLARFLLPIACLAASLLAAGPATAGARVLVGVSDDAGAMFSQRSFLRLHVPIARYIVVWNAAVMRDRTALDEAKSWVSEAEAVHVQPMISFQADPGNAGNYIPSIPVYTRAIKAFLHAVPSVKVYTPWNEPDFIYRSLARNPGLAAGYFNVMARWCHHCTIVAGDIYRPANDGLAAWIRAYRAHLHNRPIAWAIHPYDDVRGHTLAQIRTLEHLTSGPIWLTEIGGVETRGHWPWPNQSPNGANRDERFLFSLPRHDRRIARIYHYQWQAINSRDAHWDSGLLGPQGKPRPAYWTFANAASGKLP
jgi:hypothetical protein